MKINPVMAHLVERNTKVEKLPFEEQRLEFSQIPQEQFQVAVIKPTIEKRKAINFFDRLKNVVIYVSLEIKSEGKEKESEKVLVNVSSLAQRLHLSAVKILWAALWGNLEHLVQDSIDRLKILDLYEEKQGEMVTKKGEKTGLNRKTLEKVIDKALLIKQTQSPQIITVDKQEVIVDRSQGKLKVALLTKEQKLGEGTFGIIYKVLMVSSGKFKAMKITKPSENYNGPSTPQDSIFKESREELAYEIKMVQKAHENIPMDLKEWIQKPPSIVVEFSTGREGIMVNRLYARDGAKAVVDENVPLKKLSDTEQKELLLNAFKHHLKTLIYLKSKEIFHNDIKPDNLFVRVKEGKFYIPLADFGGSVDKKDFVKAVSDKNGRFDLKGTPAYLSREIERKASNAISQGDLNASLFYNERISLYALAASHYFMMTGLSHCNFSGTGRPMDILPDFDINLKNKGYSDEFILLMREMLDLQVDYTKDKDKGYDYYLNRIQELTEFNA